MHQEYSEILLIIDFNINMTVKRVKWTIKSTRTQKYTKCQ